MSSTQNAVALVMLGGFGLWYLRLTLRAPEPFAWVALVGIGCFFTSFLLHVPVLSLVGLGAVLFSRVLYQRSRKSDAEFFRQGARAGPQPQAAARAEPRSKQAQRAPVPELESAGAVPSGPIEFSAPVQAAELATDAGRLAIDAGEFRASLSLSQTEARAWDGETYAKIELTLRFADADGREWSITSVLAPQAFSDGFEQQARRTATEPHGGFVPWKEAPESMQRALRERCLIRGASVLLDSRRQFELRVGDRVHRLRLAQEEPRLDVALAEPDRLVARVSGLTSQKPASESDAQWRKLAPFGWFERRDLLLCFAWPEYHYASVAELMACARPDERTPLRARPTGAQGVPQPGVVPATG